MSTDHKTVRQEWRIPDELWARIVPLLPPRKPHPLGCHRPRVNDRRAYGCHLLRSADGVPVECPEPYGLCSSSAAHRRFQEWAAAGVFLQLWQCGLAAYDALQGIDWAWLAMDGAMTKAPLGGKRWARTPPSAGSWGPNAACSPTAAASPSAWR
jgi:putative transposase